MKFKRKSPDQSAIDPLPAMSLLHGDDLPGLVLPIAVVEVLRRTISRLILKGNLPAELSLVSALRQEGVTYISRALAAIIANDLDARVCAVELNWWWPDQTYQPAQQNGGLAAVLAGKLKLKSALAPTGNSKLAILPAGRMPLLERPVHSRSARLKEVVRELKQQYDYLVFDVPAILTTNDAIPLAALGSGCCLVVNQGVTSVEKVRQALDDIDHLPIVGVIMNKVRIATPSWLTQLIPQESVIDTGSSSAA